MEQGHKSDIEIAGWFDKIADGPLRSALGVTNHDIHLSFIVVTWIVCLLLIVVGWLVGSKLQKVPGRLQNGIELLVKYVDDFVCGIVGPEGSDYTPFILTLFLFIFLGSLIGIVPGFVGTTTNINTTAALALVAFAYVNYHAIRTVGFGAFMKGFFPPPLWMSPLIGPLEILSHLIRPLTLAVRLFGNIFGEDVVIAVLTLFGVGAMSVIKVPLPLQFPMMAFSIFTDIVQAAVFCMLTTIYIGLLTSHGHGDSHDQDHDHSHDHGHDHPHSHDHDHHHDHDHDHDHHHDHDHDHDHHHDHDHAHDPTRPNTEMVAPA